MRRGASGFPLEVSGIGGVSVRTHAHPILGFHHGNSCKATRGVSKSLSKIVYNGLSKREISSMYPKIAKYVVWVRSVWVKSQSEK
jgi:hypothetical protein